MSNASCQDPSPVIEFAGFTPTGWQGAAQHTWTEACAGHHGPAPCPVQHQQVIYPGTAGIVRLLPA